MDGLAVCMLGLLAAQTIAAAEQHDTETERDEKPDETCREQLHSLGDVSSRCGVLLQPTDRTTAEDCEVQPNGPCGSFGRRTTNGEAATYSAHKRRNQKDQNVTHERFVEHAANV